MADVEHIQPLPVRIISGPWSVVEQEVNHLLKDYVVTQWAFFAHEGVQHITAILLSQTEVRKAQIAMARMQGRS